MEWVVRYTTIKEEEARDEGAGQYQVRVRFNSENMTFNVTPNEPYTLRSQTEEKVKVPKKPAIKCIGFSYLGPKVWNHLPMEVRILKTYEAFKEAVKNWIWETIPPY